MKTYCEKTDENSFAIKDISPFGLRVLKAALDEFDTRIKTGKPDKEVLNHVHELLTAIENINE